MPLNIEQHVQARIDAAVSEARRQEASEWLSLLSELVSEAVHNMAFTLMERRDLQKEATASIINSTFGGDVLYELLGIDHLMGNDCQRMKFELKRRLEARKENAHVSV